LPPALERQREILAELSALQMAVNVVDATGPESIRRAG
jgi:uncharacterized membrane protein YgcG